MRGTTRHKGHRHRNACPCRVFTPESGAMVAVLSHLFDVGTLIETPFFGLQKRLWLALVEISVSLFGSRVFRARRKRSSCAGQSSVRLTVEDVTVVQHEMLNTDFNSSTHQCMSRGELHNLKKTNGSCLCHWCFFILLQKVQCRPRVQWLQQCEVVSLRGKHMPPERKCE